MENCGGGHTVTKYSDTKSSVSSGSWVDLKSVTPNAGRWLVLAFIEATSNSTTEQALKIVVGSNQRAVRTVGRGGGGCINYYVGDFNGNTAVKIQVYNYDSNSHDYKWNLEFIRL